MEDSKPEVWGGRSPPATHFGILGVPGIPLKRDASQEAVKNAYHRRLQTLGFFNEHSEEEWKRFEDEVDQGRTSGNPHFDKLYTAYVVLSDPEQRRVYVESLPLEPLSKRQRT